MKKTAKLSSNHNICLYFRKEPESDRFFKGDRFLRKIYRFLFRRKRIGGVERVFVNLCKSFDKLKIPYSVNMPFNELKDDDIPIVLGIGRYSLYGYSQPNRIIAGIALMTHPSEWPNLCQEYPIAKYLQHSEWANNVYRKYFGDKICDTWFSGIDTNEWAPTSSPKQIDFLIYKKFQWDKSSKEGTILEPIISALNKNDLSFEIIEYGNYSLKEYKNKLNNCKNLIFLSEHESQGFAYCEALSMDLPVLAWDQELCLDPNRFIWNDPVINASSVPFLTDVCGLKFKEISNFETQLQLFLEKVDNKEFTPRKYIIDNLSLEKSGERMLQIVDNVYNHKY